MAAPGLTLSIDKTVISDEAGYDFMTVRFTSDIAYQKFECRATPDGEDYGVGKGSLVASFSYTPGNTERSFDVYDDYLLHGDGVYRISLFAQGEDGSWNDNYGFICLGDDTAMVTADGKEFLCMR